MERKIATSEALASLIAEMVLDEAIRTYRQNLLYREIDAALTKRDKAAFLALTNELKSLHSSA